MKTKGTPDPFRVAIGTWFFKLLVGDRAGGLPADFLTHASTVLLLADEIVCDEDAFQSEMDFASRDRGRPRWVTSRVFADLHEAGLLKPLPYRRLLEPEITKYRGLGLDDQLREVMSRELRALQLEPERARRPVHPLLRTVNELFLLEFGRKGYLPYNWQEGHLLPSEPPSEPAEILVAGLPNAPEHHVFTSLAVELPHFPVVPRASVVRDLDRDAFERFSKNVAAERVPLYSWMYGDPAWNRATYNEFRSSPDFVARDEAFDRLREPMARDKLERLLEVRERTKDARPALQRYIRAQAQSPTSPAEQRAEIADHMARYHDLLPSSERYAIGVGVASAGLLAGIAAAAIANPLFGLAGVTISALSTADAVRARMTRKAAQQEEPVGFIYSEVRRMKRL